MSDIPVYAHPMADNTTHLVPGGKSMTGDGAHSPRLSLRVPAELKDQLDAAAADAGMGTSKYVRTILDDWAARR